MLVNKNLQKILIIGLGNVGYNLAHSFSKLRDIDLHIFTRNQNNLREAAQKFNCNYISTFEECNKEVFDVVILCVNDDSINDLINKLNRVRFVAYTAGAVDLKQFKNENIGVFYPLQTFRKENLLDLDNVPFFIEAKTTKYRKLLLDLGDKISSNINIANSEYRKQLHIAAVFVNNFSHFILSQGKKHCEKKNISFAHLLPLLEQTINNIKSENSEKFQTGPAKRGDIGTIKAHLKELEGVQEEVYEFLSKAIAKEHGKEL